MASTYVNDLRLNEMATGDASGSWGTVTNTNLELIGEAFSYGTETIGDANSTLTIADGAADAARSFYLKITSSVDLTTTRIVTLGPNTVSKVWMIENATTGSQVITIKQGSGATINVPNGQVKMISTDGAGSGGAVLDLLVDVDLTGTTTLVNLDVSGAVDIAGDLTLSAGGDGALRFTAASSVKVLDNDAAALVFEEADNAYMTFVTTDGSEAVKFDKALDINAATQIDATVTVGVDDTGYDVKFFGATAGAYMLWDESADDLILGGAAGLSVNSAALVTGVLTTTAATVHTGGITMPDNAKAIFGAGSDLEIYSDGTNIIIEGQNLDSEIQILSDDRVIIGSKAWGETFATFNDDGAVNLYYDGAAKLATTATGIDVTGTITTGGTVVTDGSITDTGDFTIDVVGILTLDSAFSSGTTGGIIRLKDSGTQFGDLYEDSGNFLIASAQVDKDIIFKGNDAGGIITALTLDMSDGGNATFNKDILLGDDSAIRLGASQDLALFHDATDSTIRNNTGDLILDVAGDIVLDAGGSDILLKVAGTTFGSFRENSSNFRIKSDVSDKDMLFLGNDGGVEITALTLDMSDGGNAIFSGQITSSRGAATSTYGFRHNGAGRYMRMGCPNESYAYFETDSDSGFNFDGSVFVQGALSKSSGSFKIDHPLPAKTETHNLVHSFIEGPQADNIYRGKVALVDGSATVNIDDVAGMTDGTFAVLNREVQCFTSNETGWTAVRGSVSGNILTIEAQDASCTDTISWMVIGERQDKHMYDTEWTDENGKVIVEPLKEK
jgi:hypothetical protein